MDSVLTGGFKEKALFNKRLETDPEKSVLRIGTTPDGFFGGDGKGANAGATRIAIGPNLFNERFLIGRERVSSEAILIHEIGHTKFGFGTPGDILGEAKTVRVFENTARNIFNFKPRRTLSNDSTIGNARGRNNEPVKVKLTVDVFTNKIFNGSGRFDSVTGKVVDTRTGTPLIPTIGPPK